MRAAVFNAYGPPEVLRVEEVEPPTIQAGQDDRVLIQVHSAAVNPNDVYYRSGYLPVRTDNGFLKPRQRVLGIDVAGTVAAVGKDVTRFKAGDRVFGNCWGSHAEFVRARESRLSRMPANSTFNEAAAIPTAALTGLQALRDVGRIRPGQQVVVYGASGGIGHLAVQLARHYEAEVTAVCGAASFGWVKDLGAHHLIDYAREDFARAGAKFDLILDAVGRRTFFSCRRSLTEAGAYVTVHPLQPIYHPAQFVLGSLTGDRRAKTFLAKPSYEDFDFIRTLVEDGKLKPIIDKVYPLDQIVAAHRHVETGRTKGKVVIEVREG